MSNSGDGSHFAPIQSRHMILIGLLGLLMIGVAWRACYALTYHFDGLYGQDPFAYYDYGQQVLDGIRNLHLPGKTYWPLGYPALVALGFLFTANQPLGPQIITMLSGALTGVFAFLLAHELARDRRYPWIAGLIAWLIVTCCGQLIQSSIVIMADAPALMWSTLSAWALIVYMRTRPDRKLYWIGLAAFSLGFATMTRWQYGGLTLPWAVFVLANRPIRWRHIAVALVIGIGTLTPEIIHTIRYPDPLLGHQWLQGWTLINIGQRDFVTVDGTFHYTQSPVEFYAQPLYNAYFMSPLWIPFVILGFLILIRRKEAILLLGWVLIQYGFLIGIPYENIRFALSIVTPIAVLAGIGAVTVVRWQRVLVILIILVLIIGTATTIQSTGPILDTFIQAKNRDLMAAQAIEARITQPGATVYCLDLLLMFQHYTTLQPIQIYQLPIDTLKTQLQDQPVAYAVFNRWTTEQQWVGKSPWQIYHWLLDHKHMEVLGTFGFYTLYRISP